MHLAWQQPFATSTEELAIYHNVKQSTRRDSDHIRIDQPLAPGSGRTINLPLDRR
jgi:hypothetical protein